MRAAANNLLAEGHAKQSGALRIGLLGGFSISVGDRKVDESAWRLRKAASLVKLLALAPGHRLHRDAASGRRREALQQYERLREALSRELVAEPATTTRRLRDNIEAGRFSPVQSSGLTQGELPDAGKHNLPAPRTASWGGSGR
jgi:DNA-binding SARP family transcriptional activator